MKKLISILLIFLLLLSACGGEENVPETTVSSTAAPTETVTETGPEGVLEEKDTETVYLLARMTVLNESGEESWYREYEHNEIGQLAEEFEYSNNGNLTYRKVYSYNDKGLCTAIDAYHMDYHAPETVDYQTTTSYTYDESGNVLLEQIYEDDKLVSYHEYTYDDHGNQLSCKSYYDGQQQGEWALSYTYDENGNEILREETQDGQLAYRYESRYDEQGRCIESATYFADGSLFQRYEITWEGTTSTKTWFNEDGSVSSATVTTYDSEGNITLEETQYPDGSAFMTEYTYEPFEIEK